VLPSRDEQAARLAAARAAAPRIRGVMEELEFVPEQFAEFWDALASRPRRSSRSPISAARRSRRS